MLVDRTRKLVLGIAVGLMVAGSGTEIHAQGAAPATRPAPPARPAAGRQPVAPATRPTPRARPAAGRQPAAPATRPATPGKAPAAPAARPAVPASACTAMVQRRLLKFNQEAMDENDRWELEKAKQKLDDAILLGNARGCHKANAFAVTHALLGVILQRMKKEGAMKTAWNQALKIDPNAELPARVRTGKLVRLWATTKAEAAKAAAKAAAAAAAAKAAAPKKGPPTGLEHEPVVKHEEGKSLDIHLRVGDELKATKLTLYYRTEELGTRKVDMKRGGEDKWSWHHTLKGTTIRGSQFRYFVIAYSGATPVAASGNSANMHIVQLTRAVLQPRVTRREENPLATTGPRPRVRRRVAARLEQPLEDPNAARPAVAAANPTGTISGGTTVSGPSTGPAKVSKRSFLASLGAGGGFGLLRGQTEFTNEDVPSGAVSSGSLYGAIELGYLITDNWALSVLGRIGYVLVSPTVANARSSQRMDFLGVLRLRYQSKPLLSAKLPVNLKWFAGVGFGGGVMRHIIRARTQTNDRVVDSTRSSGFIPNLFGGLMLCANKSCGVNVFVELNYMAAIGIDVDTNNYLHLDFTLGLNLAL